MLGRSECREVPINDGAQQLRLVGRKHLVPFAGQVVGGARLILWEHDAQFAGELARFDWAAIHRAMGGQCSFNVRAPMNKPI